MNSVNWYILLFVFVFFLGIIAGVVAGINAGYAQAQKPYLREACCFSGEMSLECSEISKERYHGELCK